jgi:hypothetical protein
MCTIWLIGVVACRLTLQTISGTGLVPGDAGWLLGRDIDLLIANRLRGNDKKALRLVSRAAKAVVDVTVTHVRPAPSDPQGMALSLNPGWDLYSIDLEFGNISMASEFLDSFVKLSMENLRHFCWRGPPMTTEHVVLLATAPFLGHLDLLHVHLCNAASRAFASVAEACTGLTFLGLDCHPDENVDAGTDLCFGEMSMPNLEQLWLTGVDLLPDEAERLFCTERSRWYNLEIVHLERTKLDGEGMLFLSNCWWLTDLFISTDAVIDAGGMLELAEADWIDNLDMLKLDCVGLDVTAMEAFVQGRYTNLEDLILWGNVDAEAAEVLVQATSAFPALKSLNLGFNPLGYAGACVIAKHKFKNLRALWLADTNLNEDGLVALALGNFKSLEELHINRNAFDEAALVAMGAAGKGRFPALEELRLSDGLGDTPAGKALIPLLTGRAA